RRLSLLPKLALCQRRAHAAARRSLDRSECLAGMVARIDRTRRALSFRVCARSHRLRRLVARMARAGRLAKSALSAGIRRGRAAVLGGAIGAHRAALRFESDL